MRDKHGSVTFAAFDTGVATARQQKATFTLDPPHPPLLTAADPCGTEYTCRYPFSG